MNDGAGEFQVGAISSTSLWWNGSIDEFGFWKRVLTSQERTDLYAAGAGLTYPFDGSGIDAGFARSSVAGMIG